MLRALLGIALIVFVLAACKKETPNPYDELERGDPNPTVDALPAGNFAWIHQRILRPNCALSGCHDGTFEPEFRTIGGSYNSLVLHPVIANDPQQSYTHRVVPGDVSASLLHARLNIFIPNTSGIMPLGFTENSDWPANSATYKAAIDQWIASGARDMFGRAPSEGNLQPQVTGVLAFEPGSSENPFPRGEGEGVQPIEVSGASVDLWFAFADDTTPAQALTYNKVKVVTAGAAFEAVPELPLQVGSTITGPDLGNSNTTFTHKVQVSLGDHAPGTVFFVRVYVQDADHDTPTEIPDDGTGAPMSNYFTLRVVA